MLITLLMYPRLFQNYCGLIYARLDVSPGQGGAGQLADYRSDRTSMFQVTNFEFCPGRISCILLGAAEVNDEAAQQAAEVERNDRALLAAALCSGHLRCSNRVRIHIYHETRTNTK